MHRFLAAEVRVGCVLHGLWCAEPCSCARCRTLWIVNATAISKKLWRYDVASASAEVRRRQRSGRCCLCQQSVGVEEPDTKPHPASLPTTTVTISQARRHASRRAISQFLYVPVNMSTQTKLFRGCVPQLGNDTVDFVVQIVALEAWFLSSRKLSV